MKPKKILTLLLSAVLATAIVGCNNDVGGNGSGTNLQKVNSKVSLSTTDSSAGSVAYMYKGAPIAANRQLIFEADEGQSISHITTTNPDANGKVYAIIVVEKNAVAEAGSQGFVYKVDLTASNPIATKQVIDTFYHEMPLISGFFSDGSGIVATSADIDLNTNNPKSPPPFSFYKGYQFSGKNASFFKEQIRSISVSADDSLMYIATSHHLYQTEKSKLDALVPNFDSPIVNSQPFTDLPDITALLTRTNDSIQAISLDSLANGYMTTTNGKLYTLENSHVTNESSPGQVFKPSDNAPYITSINFENPIYSRAIEKGRESDGIRTQWVNARMPDDIFSQMDAAAAPGLLLSYSCGNNCVKQVIKSEANEMDPLKNVGCGIGGIIGDVFTGNWGAFAGDTLMMGLQIGLVDVGEEAIVNALTKSTNSAIAASEVAEKFARLETRDVDELNRIYQSDLDNLNISAETKMTDFKDIEKMNDALSKTRIYIKMGMVDDAEPSIAGLDSAGKISRNGRLLLVNDDMFSDGNYVFNENMKQNWSNARSGLDSHGYIREYSISDINNYKLYGGNNNNFMNDLKATENVLDEGRTSLEEQLDENELMVDNLESKYDSDIKTIDDYDDLLEAKLANLDKQIATVKLIKYAIYSGIVVNSLAVTSVSDFMGTPGSIVVNHGGVNNVSLPGQTDDQAKHAHGFISGSFLSLNDKTLYTSESGGFDMLQDSQNNNLDNIGISVAFDGKTQYTVVAYAPPGLSTRLLSHNTANTDVILGDWRDSCDVAGTSVTNTNGQVLVQSSCKDANGTYQPSEIYVDKCGGKFNVTNKNGVLMCDSDSKPANNIIGGDWMNSCSYIKFDPTTDVYSAFCNGGGNNMTRMNIGACGAIGARNNNGVLSCNHDGGWDIIKGDWQDSCGNANVTNTNGHVLVTAECKGPSGLYQDAQIYVDKCGGNYKVTNKNGVLMCDSDSKPANTLGGNWMDSCPYIEYDPTKGVYSAFCNGSNNMTSIDSRECGGRGAQSVNGVITCN